MQQRRAKIVCTLGPANETYEEIEGLIRAGMDVARLNLSHGSHEVLSEVVMNLRRATDETGRGIGVLADLQGPKIRLGTFAEGSAELSVGQTFTITIENVPGDGTMCSTTYKGIVNDVAVGDLLLIDDGRILLRATDKTDTHIVTEVLEGGRVSNYKGINLPGVAVNIPALTEKDQADLRWALDVGVDLIALSFVRDADDILDVHRIMDEVGVRVPVLAKIEKPQAVANLDDIISAFDGIMVARGDLGVELPIEQVPLVQKRAIELAREAGKPVIVATQMLDSMTTARRPTRAEASDVANAVLDGADALMLSQETSVGDHPELVVDTMSRIIRHVEGDHDDYAPSLPIDESGSTARALTKAATAVGQAVGAKVLCAFTESGRSARLLARHRPGVPIMAFTPNQHVRSQLALVWGVETFLVEPADSTDHMVEQVDHELLGINRCQPGDRVVVVAGVPPGVAGTTNGMRVHIMGRQELDIRGSGT